MENTNQVEYPTTSDNFSIQSLNLSLRFPCLLSVSTPLNLIVVMGWLAGMTTILAGCTAPPPVSESPSPSPTATLTVTTEEIENYARAILLIEPKRREAFDEVKSLTQSEQIPNFNCTQPDQIANLREDVEKIAVNYCNQAKEIGEGQGLTIAKFNEITKTAQANPELQQRIQTEMVRLQSN